LDKLPPNNNRYVHICKPISMLANSILRHFKAIISLFVIIADWNLAKSGANPTIASYNASTVIFSNATDNLARFENKNIFFKF
jgi:hypothetical protein